MFHLVLTATPPDADVAAAASALGLTAFDLRQWQIGGVPRLVFQADRLEAALARGATLTEHGFRSLVIDASALPLASRLVEVRRFRVTDDALIAHDERPERLLFADIDALVEVATRGSLERHTFEQQPGSRMRGEPPETVEHVRLERSPITRSLYLFVRGEAAPWVLHEARARYLALGPAMHATQHENFDAFRDLVRTRAPFSPHDDRFVHKPIHSMTTVRVTGADTPHGREADRLDPLIVALGRMLTAPQGGAYRESRR